MRKRKVTEDFLHVTLLDDVQPDDDAMHRAVKQQYRKLLDEGAIEPPEKFKGQKLTLHENPDGSVEFRGPPELLNVLRVMLTDDDAGVASASEQS